MKNATIVRFDHHPDCIRIWRPALAIQGANVTAEAAWTTIHLEHHYVQFGERDVCDGLLGPNVLIWVDRECKDRCNNYEQ